MPLSFVARSALAALAALGVGIGVWACECVEPPPPAQALQQSAAVFLGQVASKVNYGNGAYLVTIDVEGWYKGGDTARVQVVTRKDGEACGFHFIEGERYLVYARDGGKDAPLQASLCSRTRHAKRAHDDGDLKALGQPKAPKAK